MQRLVFRNLSGRRREHHVAVTRLPPGVETFEHDHDFPEFFLVTAGNGRHVCNGRASALMRGTLAGVRPRDAHYFRSADETPLQFVNLAMEPGWFRRFEELAVPGAMRGWSTPPAAPQRVLDERSVERCEDQLRKVMAGRPGDVTGLIAAVAMLLGELLAPAAPLGLGGKQTGAMLPPWLAKMCTDLQDPALAAQPLAFWQKRSGRTAEHVARACRRHLGVVPTELINRARIEHVKTRLLHDDEKVAFVAEEAGFQNLGYFYRLFRRYAGMTPSAWQAAHREEAVVPR